MALRDVSDLGLVDATDVVVDDGQAPQTHRGAPASQRADAASAERARRAAPPKPRQRRSAPARRAAAPVQPMPQQLAGEEEFVVNVRVPGEVHAQLENVSLTLAGSRDRAVRRLRLHKTILGALVWRHVHPDDSDALHRLGELLDAYEDTELGDAPGDKRLSVWLPFPLKHAVDQAAASLRQRTGRRASAKVLLSALVWRYARGDQLDSLLEDLRAYSAQLAPPRRAEVGSDGSA